MGFYEKSLLGILRLTVCSSYKSIKNFEFFFTTSYSARKHWHWAYIGFQNQSNNGLKLSLILSFFENEPKNDISPFSGSLPNSFTFELFILAMISSGDRPSSIGSSSIFGAKFRISPLPVHFRSTDSIFGLSLVKIFGRGMCGYL